MKVNHVTRLILVIFSLPLGNLIFAQTKYRTDFIEFWSTINNRYAYLDQQHIDWGKVRDIYEPQSKRVTKDAEFVKLLENMLHELYNGHNSLNINLSTSNRLIPSESDMYVEKVDGRYFIKDLRMGFGADLSGLKIGMEVLLFNGKPVEEQLKPFLPKFTHHHNQKMYRYAMDMLFAGTHDVQRTITVLEDGKEKIFQPITCENINELLSKKIVNKNTAYIKINNSLGNNDVIAEFDRAVDEFLPYKNLVIDLTETPSGGTSTVARVIMGRFIQEVLPYQIHEFDEKEYDTKRHWVEYVTPRKKEYKGNVYILVGRWTGSMGEGIAIGFDGMKRAQIIGTPMAGLLGAISNFQLTKTKISVQFPTERLFHINNTPRELFVPGILTQNIEETIQKAKEIE
ncbi:S41 family peptidase [Chryseobacterium tructae]|uniref:S41 family peptidase n=1 Tax=Chryseobacterium tructae TaxID=1037380 RepID=A0ABV7XTD1_9FLAO|nr:S41 family peptidase [Chryseobacterium tructae]MDN3691773.1 S41 family peptidase [Chryseobacterium tructae]